MEDVKKAFSKVKEDINSLKNRVTMIEAKLEIKIPKKKIVTNKPKKKNRVTVIFVNKRVDSIEERLNKLEER